MRPQISISGELHARLCAAADEHGVGIIDIVERALEGEWSAEGLRERAAVQLSAEMHQRVADEVARMNALGANATVRGLLEQIVNDALDREGAPR